MNFLTTAPPSLQVTVLSERDPEVAARLHREGAIATDALLQALGVCKTRPVQTWRRPRTFRCGAPFRVTIGQRIDGPLLGAAFSGVVTHKRSSDDAEDVYYNTGYRATATLACLDGGRPTSLEKTARAMDAATPATRARDIQSLVDAKREWMATVRLHVTRNAFRRMHEVPAVTPATAGLIEIPAGGPVSRFYESMINCARSVRTALEAAGARGYQKDFGFAFHHGAESVTINGREVALPDGLRIRVHDSTVIFARQTIKGRPPKPLGVIHPGGRATFVRAAYEGLEDFIACWDEDAIETANVIGRLCTHCLLCGRELKQRASVQRGVGPDCAKEWRRLEPVFRSRGDGVVTMVSIQPVEVVETVTVATPRGPLGIPRALIEHSPVLQGLMELDDDGEEAASGLQWVPEGVTERALLDLDRMLASSSADPHFPHAVSALEEAMVAADFLDLDSWVLHVLVGAYVQRV